MVGIIHLIIELKILVLKVLKALMNSTILALNFRLIVLTALYYLMKKKKLSILHKLMNIRKKFNLK